MNAIDNFLKDFQEYSSFQEMKKLRDLIEQDSNLQKEFRELKLLQQKSVKSSKKEDKILYEEARNKFLNQPILVNYLYQVEECNDILQEVIKIINYEIVKGL